MRETIALSLVRSFACPLSFGKLPTGRFWCITMLAHDGRVRLRGRGQCIALSRAALRTGL